MWVVYRKSDGAVVGATADTELEVEKDKALKEVVGNLIDAKNPDDYDAVQVKDRQKISRLAERVARRQAKVQASKEGTLDVVDDTPDETLVVVSTNAQQNHPVDGVPLIPGDGNSFLVVTLQKTDQQGKPMTRKTKDNEVIWLRTDYGTLGEEGGELTKGIRSVQLESGTAKFRIYSERAKRLATVQMLSENPNLRLPGVRVEFT